MRKEYSKAIKVEISNLIMTKFPEFRQIKCSDSLFPGQLVFQWDVNKNLACFLILLPSQKGVDEFTIEMGWSKFGRFPELRSRPSILTPDENSYSNAEAIFRLTALSRGKDFWWKVGNQSDLIMTDPIKAILESSRKISYEEASSTVKNSIQESMSEFIQFGIPFLIKYLRHNGVDTIRKFEI
jgi:hypothetical protein